MKRRMTRVGVIGLTLVAALAIGAAPATAAKKKKPKTTTITSTVPGSFSQCQNLSVPILDNSTARATFTVPSPTGADPAAGILTAVNSVALRITHPANGNLDVFLTSPGGTVIPLAYAQAGANYGSGATNCGGTLTTFMDSAATPIQTGVAPYAGTFRPREPLSTFNGGKASGVWTLAVLDVVAGSTGTLQAASLNLSFSHIVKTVVKKKKKKKKKKK